MEIPAIQKLETLLEKACHNMINTGMPVRSDKHLKSIYAHLNDCLVLEGKVLKPRKVRSIPYTKNYDIVFSDCAGKHAIELKSISSSFGKNFNNRIEEMFGQALLACDVLGLESFSYVFVINELKEEADNRYINRLKDCSTILLSKGLLQNFVLIRIKKSGLIYGNNSNFENWNW